MTIKELQALLEKSMKSMDETNASMKGKEGEELKALEAKHAELYTEAKEVQTKLDDAVAAEKKAASLRDSIKSAAAMGTPEFPASTKTAATVVDKGQKHRDHEDIFMKYMADGPRILSDNERDFIAPSKNAGFDQGAGGASLPLSLKIKMLGTSWAKSVGYSHSEIVYALKASTMVSGTPSLGGYTIPEDFRLPVQDLPPEPASLVSRVTVIPCPTGEVTMPMSVQTDSNEFGGMTGSWISEAGEKPKTDTTFTQVKIAASEYAMHTQISHRLLSRSAIGMEQWITTKARQVCMNALDTAIISGDGSGKPLGIQQTAGIRTVARATASTVSWEDLVDLKYALRPNHRAMGVFVVEDGVMQTLEKTKDLEGRPLFTTSTANGVYDRLVGYPYISTTRLPAIGTEGDVMFVDLSEYYLAMEEDIVVKRSDDFAFTNNVATIAIFFVAGGKFIQPRVGALLSDAAS